LDKIKQIINSLEVSTEVKSPADKDALTSDDDSDAYTDPAKI